MTDPSHPVTGRRALLRGATASVAALGLGALGTGTARARTPGPNARRGAARSGAAAELLWAADFSAADSNAAGFGNVQRQYEDGDIENSRDPVPVVDAPYGMGRAGELHLVEGQMRLEAAPQEGSDLADGTRQFFRFDFALGPDYPLDQDNSFCLLNQIHHAGNDGSPPLEFDVYSNQLAIRGGWNSPSGRTYEEHICEVVKEQRYSVVYGLTLGSGESDSVIDVWVDGEQLLADYHPACGLTYGQGPAYWKGMTMYCDPSLSPLTVYENNIATGTTYASVAEL
ncbi:polysaccharide lyase [Streptomyces sp. SCSIO ZS0520]|nr:polysaccharide lyase [Streptomyces sp. SCSIO ZS0520]